MKRTFFLSCVIIFGLTFKIDAQNYPIPAPDAQWGEVTNLGPPCEPYAGSYGSVYSYNGMDTVINNRTYKAWGTSIFTRYDDNKLFKIDSERSETDSIVEIIYYDFNLAVGDSFLLPISYDTLYAMVEEVSSFITLNGQTRKKILLRAYDFESILLAELEWIEGIGAINNILFYEYQLIDMPSDMYTRTVCYSDSSGYVYKDDKFEYSCDEIESIEPFKIDAGKDTTFCYCNCDDTIRLGGNPTAFQVDEPVYCWKTINSQPASYFLDDTTIANPILNTENLMLVGESVTFELTVNSEYCENQKSDTVTIRAVQIGTTLVYFNPEINKGDTLELPHNEFIGGIEPYTYYWSPDYNISDVNASNPKAWPDTSTTYQVYIIDSIGCKSPVDFVDVIVDFSDAIQSIEINKGNFKIYPNPVTTNSVLTFNAELQSELKIKIIDSKGFVIYTGDINSNSFKIGHLILESGMYFYTINDDNGILGSGRFVKN